MEKGVANIQERDLGGKYECCGNAISVQTSDLIIAHLQDFRDENIINVATSISTKNPRALSCILLICYLE
jgi:hypothetical protein